MTEIQIPEDTSAIFDEASYIKDGKLKFTSVVDAQGNLYVERGNANATKQNASVANITYNGNGLEVWSDTTKMQAGVYDASKFTLKHYVEEGVGDHYHVTKEPTFGEGMSIPTLKMYEIITDADGRICYIAQTFHSSANWEDCIPITHCSIPQTRQFQGLQFTSVFGFLRYKARFFIHKVRQIKFLTI